MQEVYEKMNENDDKNVELLQKWGFKFIVEKERWEYGSSYITLETLDRHRGASLVSYILRVIEREKSK